MCVCLLLSLATPRPHSPPPQTACCCSERGGETLRHFLFDIAGMTGDWKMEDVLKEEMEKIRLQVCHVVWAWSVTMAQLKLPVLCCLEEAQPGSCAGAVAVV